MSTGITVALGTDRFRSTTRSLRRRAPRRGPDETLAGAEEGRRERRQDPPATSAWQERREGARKTDALSEELLDRFGGGPTTDREVAMRAPTTSVARGDQIRAPTPTAFRLELR